MRLLVFGGSFNPIHLGHLIIAAEIQHEFGYDRCLFVPSFTSRFKKIDHDPGPSLRLEMLRRAIGPFPSMGLDDWELQQGRYCYSLEMVTSLVQRHHFDGKVGFILGDDLVAQLDKWQDPQLLAEATDLICAHRAAEEELPVPLPHRYAHNLRCAISSSLIRDRIRRAGAWRHLVPSPVATYIVEKGLYA